MIDTRTLTMVACGLVLSTQALHGQDPSRYREFQLGSPLSSVEALATGAQSEAKTIHQRPAVIQELEWRPPYAASASASQDPVRQMVFSFLDDQLSRIVVDYDPDRTAGMIDADMIEAIAATYGPPVKAAAKTARAVAPPVDAESGIVLARWGNADSSVALYRATDLYRSASGSRFRLIVHSPRLEALANTAAARAVVLDGREAPQREIARQKKEAEDARLSQAKARLANKAAFRP